MGASFIDYLHHLQDPVKICIATLILACRDSHSPQQPTFKNFALYLIKGTLLFHAFPKRPPTYTKIGECLKSAEHTQWKEALYAQNDKNAEEANLFTKPIPVQSLPSGTNIMMCSIISPNIKPALSTGEI
jgi:hypothetical protein